jgi:hypothetical protein
MTAKHNSLTSSVIGFLWEKSTSDLNSEGLKTSKNTLFWVFTWLFGSGNSQGLNNNIFSTPFWRLGSIEYM